MNVSFCNNYMKNIYKKMRTMQRKFNQPIHEKFSIDKQSDEHFFHVIDNYEKLV